MSAILEPPTSVLAVSGDRPFESRLRDALAGVEDADVRVTDPEDATDVFDEHRYEIGAVVACDDVADVVDVCATVREVDDPVTIGLAACSVVPGKPCEATFADVAITRLHP